MRDIVRLKTEREPVRIKIDDGNAFWKEIEVNTGVFKLMLLSLKVNAAKLKLNLMLSVQVNAVEFWATAKVKTVNRECQLQALVDKKKVVITETSIRSDLNLKDACGTDCLLTATIFEELGKMGKDSAPTEPTTEETPDEAHVSTPSCNPPQGGKDRMKLIKLMNLCTQLQLRVLALETTKSNQALEIKSLKRRVKSLEKRRKSRTPGFKRLRKFGSASRIESSNDASLGAQEDASKQGRKIANLDADAEVTLVDETQEMNDDNLMFNTDVLCEDRLDSSRICFTDDISGELLKRRVVTKQRFAYRRFEHGGELLKRRVVTTASVVLLTRRVVETDNEDNIMKAITEAPFQMGMFKETVEEGAEGALHLGPELARVFTDLTAKEKKRYKADIHATNILLQGIPKDIYVLINHYTDAKDIWDNVKMILEGSELTKDDRESQLYDEFEQFCQIKGETIHVYYVRFTKLINDMRNIKMTMPRMQLNSKFVNNMLPEWSRFIIEVKLNRGLKESNFDQLYAY
ncbi:hypothetical protein Tco_1001573, partial [Tanacetum coccineum]